VRGKVVSVHPFGVFVVFGLDPRIPVLLEIIHFKVIDDQPGHRINSAEDYPVVGDEIEARILARFSLGLRTRKVLRPRPPPQPPLRKGGRIGSLAASFPPLAKGGSGGVYAMRLKTALTYCMKPDDILLTQLVTSNGFIVRA
jgi:hypothetical protein